MKIAFYRYLVTAIVVAIAATTAWLLYRKYVTDPWTRDSQIRANIVGIAPRVAGPIINIPVQDNQEVKAGDLLFEIDPADYKTALESAKAAVASLEANLLQKQQDLDRETELFRRSVDSKQLFQNAQNAFAGAQAQLNAARANLQQAELAQSCFLLLRPWAWMLRSQSESKQYSIRTLELSCRYSLRQSLAKAWNPSGVIFHSRTGWMSSPTIWRSAATKPHPSRWSIIGMTTASNGSKCFRVPQKWQREFVQPWHKVLPLNDTRTGD